MSTTFRSSLIRLSLVSLITLISIAALSLSVRRINAEAAAAPGLPSIGLTAPTITSVVITLTAVDDVDATQRGDHNATYPNSYLVLSQDAAGHYDNNYVLFDMSVLPANATVNSAELHLNVSIANGTPLTVEMARVESVWDGLTGFEQRLNFFFGEGLNRWLFEFRSGDGLYWTGEIKFAAGPGEEGAETDVEVAHGLGG